MGKVLKNRNADALVQIFAKSNKTGMTENDNTVRTFAEDILGLLPASWLVEK